MAVSSSSPLVAVGDEVVGLTCLLVAAAAALAVAATGALPPPMRGRDGLQLAESAASRLRLVVGLSTDRSEWRLFVFLLIILTGFRDKYILSTYCLQLMFLKIKFIDGGNGPRTRVRSGVSGKMPL